MNPLPGTKLTDRLVPVRLPKRDAYVQLLTSPVREAQVVDRTGSGTCRSIQDVRASSHIMNTWFKQLCLLYLKSLPGRSHGNSCRTRNIWTDQIDLAHKPKGRRSAGSRGLGDSGGVRTRGRANPKEMQHLFPVSSSTCFRSGFSACSRRLDGPRARLFVTMAINGACDREILQTCAFTWSAALRHPARSLDQTCTIYRDATRLRS